MFEKTLSTTEGKLRVKIPTTLQELTVGQLLQLQTDETLSDLQSISILSHIPYDTLLNITDPNEIQDFERPILTLVNSIQFMYDKDAIPEEISFVRDDHYTSIVKQPKKGFFKRLFSPDKPTHNTVKVLKNLSIEPVGAYMNARDIISDEINEHIKRYGEQNWRDNLNPSTKSIGMLLAHYFYCPATRQPYNENKAEQFFDVVKHLSVAEAMPIGRYFFLKYPDLLKQKTSFWQQVRQYWKQRQALKNSRNIDISIL